MTTTADPYAEAFEDYWAAGWRGILPLPYGQKTPPPAGYTGHDGVDPSYADCHAMAEEGPANICLRLPDGVIGIDVDDYNGKNGGATLSELVAKFGALPPTWLSTSRADGISGIRIYKVPAGTVLPTKLTGIEFIQHWHRYIVAAPSLHPEGATYGWVDERDASTGYFPIFDEVPELPARWLAGLQQVGREVAVKADLTGAELLATLTGLPKGEPCQHVLRAAGLASAGGDRHDSYNAAVLAVAGAGRRGCPGAPGVLERLGESFVSELTDDIKGRGTRAEAVAEFKRGLVGALQIIAGESQGAGCPDDVLDWLEIATALPTDDAGEILELTPYEQAVHRRFADLRVNDDAKTMLAAVKAGQAPTLDGLPLVDFLAQPDEAERYRVEGLWPAEGRVLLAAAAKSGKTTMVVGNLIPALVDGRPFLGRFNVTPVAGRVVLFNMEVGPRTLRGWMRRAGINATNQVEVVNLRGKASALALGSDEGRRRLADYLARQQAEVVILDPLAPVLASLALDENSNADVAVFFAWWSEALGLAGVTDDLVVHHTGHAGERSRGASRLLDEPDAIWTLTKMKDTDGDEADPIGMAGPRFLAAYGRDVDLIAEGLAFDSATGGLILTGKGRRETGSALVESLIWEGLQDGLPRSKNDIVTLIGKKRDIVLPAIDRLAAAGRITETGGGKWPKYASGSQWFPLVSEPPNQGGSRLTREPLGITTSRGEDQEQRGNHLGDPWEEE
jgi:hypothetical protein